MKIEKKEEKWTTRNKMHKEKNAINENDKPKTYKNKREEEILSIDFYLLPFLFLSWVRARQPLSETTSGERTVITEVGERVCVRGRESG